MSRLRFSALGGMLSVLREHETTSKLFSCSRSTESMPPQIVTLAQIRAPSGERLRKNDPSIQAGCFGGNWHTRHGTLGDGWRYSDLVGLA